MRGTRLRLSATAYADRDVQANIFHFVSLRIFEAAASIRFAHVQVHSASSLLVATEQRSEQTEAMCYAESSIQIKGPGRLRPSARADLLPACGQVDLSCRMTRSGRAVPRSTWTAAR